MKYSYSFRSHSMKKCTQRDCLVSQDVQPFNEDYNFKELSNYNDYVILMAYDQFSDGTGPGPIVIRNGLKVLLMMQLKKFQSINLSWPWQVLDTTGNSMIMIRSFLLHRSATRTH